MSEETKSLSEAEKRVIELDREKAIHTKFYEDYDAAIKALAEERGVGHTFQDDEGIVYKVTVPAGTFVSFRAFGVDRTRRVGESRGSLSLKEAKELGFEPFAGPFDEAEKTQEASA